jgi:hypothetical protein
MSDFVRTHTPLVPPVVRARTNRVRGFACVDTPESPIIGKSIVGRSQNIEKVSLRFGLFPQRARAKRVAQNRLRGNVRVVMAEVSTAAQQTPLRCGRKARAVRGGLA